MCLYAGFRRDELEKINAKLREEEKNAELKAKKLQERAEKKATAEQKKKEREEKKAKKAHEQVSKTLLVSVLNLILSHFILFINFYLFLGNRRSTPRANTVKADSTFITSLSK